MYVQYCIVYFLNTLAYITEPAPLPLTPPDGEHLTVKKELENIRHNLGSDWLQSLAIQHPQSSHPAAKRVSPTTDPSKPESVDLPDKTGVIIEVVPASSAPVSEEGSWQRGCNLSGDSTAPAKATFQVRTKDVESKCKYMLGRRSKCKSLLELFQHFYYV